MHMGITAENVAERYGITREMQDEFAINSQKKAIEAQDAGKFVDEIVPLTVKVGRKEIVFDADEYINRATSLEKLGTLRPAFKPDGTVTAGNASGINDGASFCVLASEAAVEKYGCGIAVTDYKDVLADPEVEAISVCTPNAAHSVIAIAALKAGKDKPEKEEKPQRPQRPAPQRAASYTGQVMPSILSEKAVSLEESAQGLEEQGTLEEKKSTHRGRRGGKHRGGRREGEKGQRPEKGERSERNERGEQSGQQSEKSGGKNRPPRFEKQSREGENKGEQSRAPRYEKTSREENQPKKGGEQQGVRQQNGNAPKKEGEQKKKNHRPFRHFGKKKDGE
jgi:hypothetical protein